MINFIFITLVLLAVCLSVLTVGSLLFWLKGGNMNILLPGLGLVIAFPVVPAALSLIQFVVIMLAAFVSNLKPEKLS